MNTSLPVNEIITMYRSGDSIQVIADRYNTYGNKILRLLKKYGQTIRDRSEAQKTALETSRAKHPTKGRKRTEEEKIAISESVHEYWKNMDDDKRNKIVEKMREKWNNIPEDQKINMRKSAAAAVRKASKEGSKLENFLNEELPKHGFDVIFHKKGMIIREEMELDLLIPSAKTVIEIDGPSHFYPIWGEENLMKHIKADAHKSGLLLNAGFVVIRVKHLISSLSAKHKRDVLAAILEILNKVKENFPELKDRYIELEVN